MVICLEQNADLHMAQPMPLPLNVSCCSKIQIGVTFLVPAHPGSPGKRAIKWVCGSQYFLDQPNKSQGMGRCILYAICPTLVLYVYLKYHNMNYYNILSMAMTHIVDIQHSKVQCKRILRELN